MHVYVISTCVPDENEPCFPTVVFSNEAAEAAFAEDMRQEWERNGTEDEETGERLPFPDDPHEAHRIMAETPEWGRYEITGHSVPTEAVLADLAGLERTLSTMTTNPEVRWRSLLIDPPGPEHREFFVGHSEGGRMDLVFRWPHPKTGKMAFWKSGKDGNYVVDNYDPDVWYPGPPPIPNSFVEAVQNGTAFKDELRVAHGFHVGQFVTMTCVSIGDDHEGTEHRVPPGATGKIDRIERLAAPQGISITVVISTGKHDAKGEMLTIVNSFDEEDGHPSAFFH